MQRTPIYNFSQVVTAIILTLSTLALASDSNMLLVFTEKEGVLCIEAEHAQQMSPSTFKEYQTPHEWQLKIDQKGFSGDGFMQVLPDERGEDGNGQHSPRDNSGAEMVYPIRIHQAGTYHVFIRGMSMGGESNGLHLGIDGHLAGKEAGASNISGFRPHHQWCWERKRKHGYEGTAQLTLTKGDHSLYVWSRDDAFRLDKILLSLSDAAPEGIGPAESIEATKFKQSTPTVALNKEQDGVISIEAESGRVTGWDLLPGVSGSALIDVSERGQGSLSYEITFTGTGKYYMYLLCKLTGDNGGQRNDCFVTLDGEKLFASDGVIRPDGMRTHTRFLDWSFLPKGPGHHTPPPIKNKPVYFQVNTPGRKTLTITSRSMGLIIDKIMLVRNGGDKKPQRP